MRATGVSLYFFLIVTLSAVYSVAAEPPKRKDRNFPDFGQAPPPSAEYDGRLFRMSQDFPDTKPGPESMPKFLGQDFHDDWRAYSLAVRSYCFDGNILGGNVNEDFDVGRKNACQWFHMPWQHYGPKGRECVHGLTKEAKINPRQLAWTQVSNGQTYAVACYNRIGAYAIGKVWADPEQPQLHDIRFEPGTVVFKLLFADIPLKEVGSLNPPLTWCAYVTDNYDVETRQFKELALIQMDFMVRDDHSPCGWVFGTFQYNGETHHDNRRENLVPVGLQWGNDPNVREHRVNFEPIETLRNSSLKETIINPDDKELPPTHLGWNGRLNGPVDNPMSSCMSCHATAQVRQKSQMSPLFEVNPPVPGSEPWMRWFANYKCGSRFDDDVPGADFSLQLAMSIQNWQSWKNETHQWRTGNYEALVKKQKSLPHAKLPNDAIAPDSEAPVTRNLSN